MGRGTLGQWFHEHHLLPETGERLAGAGFGEILRSTWVVIVLLLLGLLALITAVLIAWPALSIIGAKLFG